MALQIWLPLKGNLNNQGLSDLEFSIAADGPVAIENGKIGKAYSNNGSGALISNKKIYLGRQHSMFCWMKLNAFNSSSNLTGLFGQHRYQIKCGMGPTCKYESATTGRLSITWGDGSSRYYTHQYGNTILNANQWYHVGYTYDGNQIKLYVNGKLDGEFNAPEAKIIEDYFQIFAWSFGDTNITPDIYSGYKTNGILNDVRVYDHCCSEKEIKHIAQGLVAHYPLKDQYLEKTTNILKQPTNPTLKTTSPGWIDENHIGALNVSNWSDGYNGGVKNTKYHAHWVEYDDAIVMKFPNINKTVTGSSKWLGIYTMNTDYTEFLGPNTTYTISFDAKSEIEGLDLRVGYYYRKTGDTSNAFHDGYCIAKATTSWQRYSATFTTSSDLNPEILSSFYAYGYNNDVQTIGYIKNIQVEIKDHATGFTKTNRNEDICYDCSGYSNNGAIGGNLQIINNSPRGDYSAKFSGAEYINLGRDPMITDAITVSLWCYLDDWSKFNNTMRIISCTESGGWNFENIGYFICYANSKYNNAIGDFSKATPGWHLLTGTWDGKQAKVYLDGILQGASGTLASHYPITYNSTNSIFIGAEAAGSATTPGGPYFKGNISDVRIYATALSDEDILELYNAPIAIDNKQQIFSYEFKEV